MAQKHQLRYLFLELTSRCNLRCRHCGSSCPENGVISSVDTPVLVRLIDVIAERAPHGSVMFCLTGGEPLLREDWDVIGAYISNKGFPWGMTTNGTMITDAVVERMAASGMSTVSVSLDGMEQSHQWLRRVEGCFEKAVQGIRLLVNSRKFRCVQVTTVVNPRNLPELEEMYCFLCQLGVDSWKLTGTEPIGSAKRDGSLFLSPVQYRNLLEFIRKKKEENTMEITFGCSHFLPQEYEAVVRAGRFHCLSGISIASVSATGEILGCLDIDNRAETRQGNVCTDDFWDVWEREFSIFRNPRDLSHSQCGTCAYRLFCGGDSWHTWDFLKKAPRICLINDLEG